MKELLSNSTAYKVICADKKANKLSHSYLVVCSDGDMHDQYLSVLAKLICCDSQDYCDNCRVCRLIDKREHPDITFLPKEGKLKSDSADLVVRQSVVRPFELDKRLFVVKKIEQLNQYQNKLLKTVEEPPKNVHLLISTERPVAVLPTIKSRCKVVEIADFGLNELEHYAKKIGFSGERLDLSLKLCGGKLGDLIRYYQNDDLINIKDLSIDMLCNMTGRNLPEYAGKLKSVSIKDFISVTKLMLDKLLNFRAQNIFEKPYEKLYQSVDKWGYGAIIATIERLSGFEKSLNFNINNTIIIDGILFACMEEKTKWQKL